MPTTIPALRPSARTATDRTEATEHELDELKDEDGRQKQTPPSAGANPAAQQSVPASHATVIISGLTVVYFLVMLDNSIISTAVPYITSEFDSLLDVGWYGSAYQVAASAFVPLTGGVYRNFSNKWSFFIFFLLFELGSVICGAAQSSAMLIVGRAIAGVGGSGILNGAMTIVACVLPPRQQALVMGINVSLGQIGMATGPLIGGAFTEKASWRWCFLINAPIGVLVAFSWIFVTIPEGRSKPAALHVFRNWFSIFDMAGFALVAPATAMLLLALEWGGTKFAWGSGQIVGLFVGAAAAWVAFFVWERRQAPGKALVPLLILKRRVVLAAAGTMFFFAGVVNLAAYYMPIYFQAVHDDTPLESGVHTLPSALSQAVFSLMSGTLIHALGYYLPWVMTGSSLAAVGYGLLSTLSVSTTISQRIGYQIPIGVGIGAASSSSYIAMQSTIPKADISVAMAIVIFVQYLGGAIWLSAGNTIFSNTLKREISSRVPSVNANTVIAAGATAFRQLVSAENLPSVLEAYSRAIDSVFYLGVGMSLIALGFGSMLGWRDIRKKSTVGEESKELEDESVGEASVSKSTSVLEMKS